MPNPVLNERTMRSAQANWAPPEPPTLNVPMTDGPVSTWSPRVMTVNGTLTATATLFVILLASAAVGWIMVGEPNIVEIDGQAYAQSKIPMLAWGGLIVGIVIAALVVAGIVIWVLKRPKKLETE